MSFFRKNSAKIWESLFASVYISRFLSYVWLGCFGEIGSCELLGEGSELRNGWMWWYRAKIKGGGLSCWAATSFEVLPKAKRESRCRTHLCLRGGVVSDWTTISSSTHIKVKGFRFLPAIQSAALWVEGRLSPVSRWGLGKQKKCALRALGRLS